MVRPPTARPIKKLPPIGRSNAAGNPHHPADAPKVVLLDPGLGEIHYIWRDCCNDVPYPALFFHRIVDKSRVFFVTFESRMPAMTGPMV